MRVSHAKNARANTISGKTTSARYRSRRGNIGRLLRPPICSLMAMETPTQPGVVLLHGWASCYADTWQATGITDLFADDARQCIGVDLMGHGNAPKPHDPSAYDDMGERIRSALPKEPVDAVGFSLGALVLLEELIRDPRRFRKVVLAGIGDGVFAEHDDADNSRIISGLQGTAPQDDNLARLFGQYAAKSSNDVGALIAVLKRKRPSPYTEQSFAHITNDILIVVGDRDFVLPADRLGNAFVKSELQILRNTDHFKTPESFSFISTVMNFLNPKNIDR